MAKEVVQIKGTRQGLVIRLYPRADIQAVKSDLTDKLEKADGFFRGAKYLLDRDQKAIPDNEQRELHALLRRYGLVPAATMPLPVTQIPPRSRPRPRADAPALPAGGAPALLLRHSLRSGQSVKNPDGHVVVLGNVNPGARIKTAHCVLIFGECRGDVLAGSESDAPAWVVSRSFHGSLIAVNGVIGYPEAESQPDRFLKALAERDQVVVKPLK